MKLTIHPHGYYNRLMVLTTMYHAVYHNRPVAGVFAVCVCGSIRSNTQREEDHKHDVSSEICSC